MLLLLAFLFLAVLAIVHYCHITFSWQARCLRNIPGPTNIPFIGSIYVLHGATLADVWKNMRILSKQDRITKVWSFLEVAVNIHHPDDIEVALSITKYFEKGLLYKMLMPWFGTGLLNSSGPKWTNRRKILTPAFHYNILQQFIDSVIEETEYLVSSLKAEKGPAVREVLEFVSEHTLNVICVKPHTKEVSSVYALDFIRILMRAVNTAYFFDTAMGTSLKGRGEFQYKYRKAVHDMGGLVIRRVLKPWFMLDFLYYCSPDGFKHRKTLKILHDFTKEIIKERKQYHADTGDKYLTGFDTNDSGPTQSDKNTSILKKRLALLDLLLAAQKEHLIDNEGIREEVDTFMFAGHDTAAVAMCYSIMLFAEHPKIQEKARAEVDEVFLQCGGKLTMSDLQRLPYLERCVKEVLRLYPSAPLIARKYREELQINGHTIPRGCIINIHIVDVHRDPEFWPQPEVFDPDRFLPENCQGRHSYCYLPFSAGHRNCIGQRFALLEIKATLAYLIHNFRLEPIDYLRDCLTNADIVMRPDRPLRARFIPIH